MNDQELEYHVRKLEKTYTETSDSTRAGMRPGIEKMIRSIKASKHSLPLSLKRLERRLAEDEGEDFFDNMPV